MSFADPLGEDFINLAVLPGIRKVPPPNPSVCPKCGSTNVYQDVVLNWHCRTCPTGNLWHLCYEMRDKNRNPTIILGKSDHSGIMCKDRPGLKSVNCPLCT